jgi:hypothetical protein
VLSEQAAALVAGWMELPHPRTPRGWIQANTIIGKVDVLLRALVVIFESNPTPYVRARHTLTQWQRPLAAAVPATPASAPAPAGGRG